MDYSYKQRLAAFQSEQEEQALKRAKQSKEITEKRLDSIGNIHKSMQEMLAHQKEIKELRMNDLDNQIHHNNKLTQIEQERIKNISALNQLEADTRNKLYNIQLEQMIAAQTLKLQRMQQQFDSEQKLKHQLLEDTMNTKDNISNFEFIQQKNLLSSMSNLQNKYDTEQSIKHKLKLQELINENKQKEIEQENDLTNAMNQQLNITSNMIQNQTKLQNIMSEQEEFEIDAMTEQYKKFKNSVKKQKENILNQHKSELLEKLKEQQIKINNLSKQQRLKQFESVLLQQKNEVKDDVINKESQLQETINLVQKQIKDLHEKEMELEMRGKEMVEKNAFEQVAKEAESVIIEQEKEKYANIRESMLREMEKKEERLRERHEEIMKKLMAEREEQLINIGHDAKQNVYNENVDDLEKEYEIKKAELQALKDSYNEKQDAIRNELVSMK